MSSLTGLGLVDVGALLLVVLAVVGGLRRGAGVLGAVGSALGAALVVWLAVGAAATWGSPAVASAAGESRVAHVVPVPQHAFHQAGQLLGLHPTTERSPR